MSEWLVWRWQPGTGTRPLPGSRQQSSLGGDPVSFDLALPAGGPPAPDHLWLLRAPCRPGPWFHGGFVHRAPGCEPQKPPSRACEPLSEPVAAEGPGPRPGPPPPWTPGAGGAGDPRGVGGCRERACSPCRWSKADLHGGRGVAGAGSVLVETSPASGHTVTAGAGAGRRGGRPPSTVGGSGRGGGSVRWPRAHGAQPPGPLSCLWWATQPSSGQTCLCAMPRPRDAPRVRVSGPPSESGTHPGCRVTSTASPPWGGGKRRLPPWGLHRKPPVLSQSPPTLAAVPWVSGHPRAPHPPSSPRPCPQSWRVREGALVSRS